mgnify:CR=1 FL=1
MVLHKSGVKSELRIWPWAPNVAILAHLLVADREHTSGDVLVALSAKLSHGLEQMRAKRVGCGACLLSPCVHHLVKTMDTKTTAC